MLMLSVSTCVPFLGTQLMAMMFFSLMCRDLFGSTTVHFADFGMALTTTFRLFVGEGWHYIMYDTAEHTSNATKFLFMLYVFFSTLLFGQLVLGVIIAVFGEVKSFSSPRLYDALKPLNNNLNESERARLFSDFLKINWILMGIHEKIGKLESEAAGPS